MKQIILAIVSAVLMVTGAMSADVPTLQGRVTDMAGVFSTNQRSQITERLAVLESSGAQVAVLTVANLPGDIEGFANATFRAWRLGQSGKDNGLLIVIAPSERKIRIEVGYGLEGSIPDSRAASIIATDMRPHLARGTEDYAAAVNAALLSIAKAMEPKAAVEAKPPMVNSETWLIMGILGFAVGLFVIVLVVARPRRREEESDVLAAATTMGAVVGGAGLVGASAAMLAASQRQERLRHLTPRPREPSRSSGSDHLTSALLGAMVGSSLSSSSRASSSSDSSSSWSSSSDSSSFSGGGGDSGGGGSSGDF